MADRVLAEQVHTKPLVLLPKKYEDMSLIAIIVNKEGGIEMFSNGTQSKEKAYDALSKCLKEVEETKNNAVHEVRPGQAWLPPTAVGCD